jgi:hypothetical protein
MWGFPASFIVMTLRKESKVSPTPHGRYVLSYAIENGRKQCITLYIYDKCSKMLIGILFHVSLRYWQYYHPYSRHTEYTKFS